MTTANSSECLACEGHGVVRTNGLGYAAGDETDVCMECGGSGTCDADDDGELECLLVASIALAKGARRDTVPAPPPEGCEGSERAS